MLINLITDNSDFVLKLYESQTFKNNNQFKETDISIEEPTRNTGAFESWYEIAASIGIIGIPVGVLVNLFSSWIWDAYIKTKDPTITIKLILEKGNEIFDIELTGIKNLEEVKERLHLLYSNVTEK